MAKTMGIIAVPMGIIVGVAFFYFWMSMVGSPHVVETAIGTVISFVAVFFAYWKLAKLGKST